MGRLPDRRYEMLSSDYEKEQGQIEISMKEIREKLIQFENDTDRAKERLKADDMSHIASVVAGENKITVESGIFPTKEEVKAKYAI